MMGVRGQIDIHICHCTARVEKQIYPHPICQFDYPQERHMSLQGHLMESATYTITRKKNTCLDPTIERNSKNDRYVM